MKWSLIKKHRRRVLGFFREEKKCFCTLLEKEGAQIRILDSVTFDGEYPALKLFLSQWTQPVPIASGLPSEEVLIRHIELPLTKKSSVKEALPFQYEDILPYALAQAFVLSHIHTEKTKSLVTLFATSKERCMEHLACLKKEYLYPDYLSCEPQALSRFVRYYYREPERLFVLQVKEKKALFIYLERDMILRSITFTYDNLDKFNEEMRRLCFFLEEKKMVQAPWLILEERGWGQKFLKEHGQMMLLSAHDPEITPYATSFGLALDALSEDAYSLQFAQGECAPKHQAATCHTKLKQLYWQFSLSLIAIFTLSFLPIHHKRGALAKELQKRAELYFFSDKELKERRTFDEKMAYLKDRLFKEKKKSVSASAPPLVSHVLAYLSEHPQLQKGSGIEIQHVRYELVSYPTLDKPNAPYLARVDLTLTSESTVNASQFYEALRKGDSLVDPKKEIKWNRNEGGYHVSFFLKPAL